MCSDGGCFAAWIVFFFHSALYFEVLNAHLEGLDEAAYPHTSQTSARDLESIDWLYPVAITLAN